MDKRCILQATVILLVLALVLPTIAARQTNESALAEQSRREAEESIDGAQSAIDFAKKWGANTTESEKLLQRAMAALSNGDYQNATRLAQEARERSVDEFMQAGQREVQTMKMTRGIYWYILMGIFLVFAIILYKRRHQRVSRASRIHKYKVLLRAGLSMLLVGFIMLSASLIICPGGPYRYCVGETCVECDGTAGLMLAIGGIMLFFGGMCALSGWLGIREEKKRIRRVRTGWGVTSFIVGLIGLFTSSTAGAPIIFGVCAIPLGLKAKRHGDNELGPAGIWCGVIDIVMGAILIFIFYGLRPSMG